MSRRRVCYVTGTRAEFGLMQTVLQAIRDHPRLDLQLVVTGMHLSRSHGQSIRQIRHYWSIDSVVPWKDTDPATATTSATRKLVQVFDRLEPDIVLVCGDRVEAFAAASAGLLDGRIVAHVHGGDRALGQLDDTLRHAITKLSHLHFPATHASARRILRMGEQKFRIHTVGTPGLDGIRDLARSVEPTDTQILVLVHPDSPDEKQQYRQTRLLLEQVRQAATGRVVAVYPNNDPGWEGVARALEACSWIRTVRDLPRAVFLRHLMDARVLVGNSSSGIIEAASLGTPVVNIGPRQKGREKSRNVRGVPWEAGRILHAIQRSMKKRFRGKNVYGEGKTGLRIARILSDVELDDRLYQKLIRY
ncbi:MAG: UDP-N,N'-diacetylbacillosamine 2-epimerase (hydrolyzing) [Phycisphaerae bacterium]|nr:MAG: UDP-N,N'-diacetylbacillosamine 2-epimerase (hydrolyzing) [Phycisphaerae bacterium]